MDVYHMPCFSNTTEVNVDLNIRASWTGQNGDGSIYPWTHYITCGSITNFHNQPYMYTIINKLGEYGRDVKLNTFHFDTMLSRVKLSTSFNKKLKVIDKG